MRLLAEEFSGRAITPDEGARANLLTLFTAKLARLETEARSRAGGNSWPAGLHLLRRVLREISRLCLDRDVHAVPDVDVMRAILDSRPDFTADRIHVALTVLIEHGLVDRWARPASGLDEPNPELALATRHLSDFVLAITASEQVIEPIRRGEAIPFPRILRRRDAAAVLFAAALVEGGYFATDIRWKAPPRDLEILHAEALSLVGPTRGASRRAEIGAFLLQTTRLNRAMLRSLVLPVARIPDHPLGPRLLDEALRRLPLTERDPLWSVPEGLRGHGPWAACYDAVLDEIELVPEVDDWTGLPLVVAWTCASVVEERRRKARESLAVWGSVRLDQMVLLLEHMASVDDPQVVDDIVVAALGAAIGSPIPTPALKDLGILVDRLFFSDSAVAWTPSVPVRVAARGIVERAVLIYPSEFTELVARATPPYRPRAATWPGLDAGEFDSNEHFGGKLVTYPACPYVAGRCFSAFAEIPTPRAVSPEEAIDYRLQRAIREGRLTAPELRDVLKREEAVERRRRNSEERRWKRTLERVRAYYSQVEETDAGTLSEADLLRWALARPEFTSGQRKDAPKGHSEAFRELMAHASALAAGKSVSPVGVQNALIAHVVRGWGWSEAGFSKYEWQKPPTVVDDAIAKDHGSGPEQGSRSAEATFREKYIFAAVERVAGDLADRLPVWSHSKQAWTRVDSLDGLGIGMPDPLPHSLEGDGREIAQVGGWRIEGILPPRFAGEANIAKRAEAWLTDERMLDPRMFVRATAERWPDAAVLAFGHFHRGHEGCVDQLVQVRAFGVPAADVDLLRRDAPFIADDLQDAGAWVESGVYVSPALATWAPWLTWCEDNGYNSFGDDGAVRRVTIKPAVGSFTARFEGEWPQEPTIWMPSPMLARPLGLCGMRGGRWVRHYTDRDGAVVATERDMPGASFARDHQYLVMDLGRFLDILASNGLVPVWAVRIYREATPALFMRGHGGGADIPDGLNHHHRDATWLVVGNPLDRLDVIKVSDVADLWQVRKRAGGDADTEE